MEETYKSVLRNEDLFKDKVKLLQDKLDEKRTFYSNEILLLLNEK